MKPLCPEDYSPAAWAYIGDAYYELAMRMLTLGDGPKRMSDLHRDTAKFVTAAFQAKAARLIAPMLTDMEREVMRRGRNTRSGQIPKSATATEYRQSTGIEALIGYLYLTRAEERAMAIISTIRQLEEEGE